MTIDIITLFPEMFQGPFAFSILKRAQEKELVKIHLHNLRKWTKDKRGTVDDKPYGGGSGMVLKLEPLIKAVKELKTAYSKTILLSPRGHTWNQKLAQKYSQLNHLIFICGHYEGVDERIKNFIDEEISIGDYILTGGELPAMVLIDSLVRLIPDVLTKPEATQNESFSNYTLDARRYTLLEYPQYTKPENFQGLKVPRVLLSGNHQEIAKWRQTQALQKTSSNRPDLIKIFSHDQ